jgi:nucleoside phosphorylase
MPEDIPIELDSVTIGIVAALPHEYAALTDVFAAREVRACKGRDAGSFLRLARVPSVAGGSNVVALLQLADMGNDIAAAQSTILPNNCGKLKYVVMCGIAGAVPHPEQVDSHVRLGDIVIPDRIGVIQYDLIKRETNGDILRNPPRPPAAVMLSAARELHGQMLFSVYPWETHISEYLLRHPDWSRPDESLDILNDSVDGRTPTIHPTDSKRRPGHPKVFQGAIGSANILLKDPNVRNRLRDEDHIKAVEMEGAGIADAGWLFSYGFFIVRGTCDYCNMHKNDVWQNYAALVAAAYTRSLIESIGPLLDGPEPGPMNRLDRDSAGIITRDLLKGVRASNSPITIVINNGTLNSNIQPSALPVPADTLKEDKRGASVLPAIESREKPDLEPVDDATLVTTGLEFELYAEADRLLNEISRHCDLFDFALAESPANDLAKLLSANHDVFPKSRQAEYYLKLAELEATLFRLDTQCQSPHTAALMRSYLTLAEENLK